MWMKHKGLYSSSWGFAFMPTSSLNNDCLKMLCPLLPTHPCQSVRAAYPKYYSNPLVLPCACVKCFIRGRSDNSGSIFCVCSCVFRIICIYSCVLIVQHNLSLQNICAHECVSTLFESICTCVSLRFCHLQPPALALCPSHLCVYSWH